MDYPDGDLTIDREGLARLDAWRKDADRDDADRVAELLVDVSKRRWQGVWWAERVAGDSDITAFQPREGLYVYIRLWADVDQFTIDGFSDMPPEGEED